MRASHLAPDRRFGARYRVGWEADGATRAAWPEDERLWLLEIRCRYGVIYPHGGNLLAATITSRRIGQQVAALPCIRSRRGDVELVVTFHVNDAEAVLALLKPRRVYAFTESRQRAAAAALSRSPLRLGRERENAGQEEAETGVEIDATPAQAPLAAPVTGAPSPAPSTPARTGEEMTEPQTLDLTEQLTEEDLDGLSEAQQRDLVLARVAALIAWAENLGRHDAW